MPSAVKELHWLPFLPVTSFIYSMAGIATLTSDKGSKCTHISTHVHTRSTHQCQLSEGVRGTNKVNARELGAVYWALIKWALNNGPQLWHMPEQNVWADRRGQVADQSKCLTFGSFLKTYSVFCFCCHEVWGLRPPVLKVNVTLIKEINNGGQNLLTFIVFCVTIFSKGIHARKLHALRFPKFDVTVIM